ncbi:MAG: hypothetical protein SPG97_02340 [Bacilli bacterium]|nr:hypothetical protein [Bacilli bacterium]
MRKFAEIIESTTVAPPTNCLWIKGNDALYFTNGKWVSLFKKEDFINITDRFNKHSMSLIEAIQTVPTHQRIDGLVITFEDINGDWRIYQFRGDVVDFFDENKWTDLYDYTNYIVKSITPDEEDLTVSKPDKNGNAIVSLKDKVYDESNFSGKGYKILRKNIQTIDGVRKNILTQDMINNPDTIYEIRYDFDLNNINLTIPENCILSFNGGILKNGKIIGDKTRLTNFIKLKNIAVDGTFENEFCRTSYYISDNEAIDNINNLNNLFKISRNVIVDSKRYIISNQLILPCDANFSCDIGCSILLKNLGCIYVTHSNRLSNINIYIDKDFNNLEHLIVINTEYIYKSIENTPKSYASLFNIYIDNLFIDYNGKPIDKIIDICDDTNKNGWNINISNCVFQCSSNIAISLVTKGEGSWLNGTYFNNVKTVYSKVGFYINGSEGSIPPENVSITQCSMQCISTSTYFVEARSVHRLYVFFCEPWDWNIVKTNPFLFTDKCSGVNVMSSGGYSDYDFDGDRTSTYNTINYMCGNFSANISNFFSSPKPPKNGSTYTLKEIQTMPRGVYKIPSDSRIGERFGVTSPLGGLMIIDGGTQGSVFITYYDVNKEIYFYSNTKMLANLDDRTIQPSDWLKVGKLEETENPLEYNYHKLYLNSNDKLYYLDKGGNRRDSLGRTFVVNDDIWNIDISKLNNLTDKGRTFYHPGLNKLVVWSGTKLLDVFGYDGNSARKGDSANRPNMNATQAGYQYYDTTLKKYIVWNGTEWTNMDGTTL